MAKILVIDDEECIRVTFESFLSEKGHTIVAARGYGEALAKMKEAEFDLIFTDIILGDRTGIDVLREAKERNLASPVVMITGYPDIETASEALRLGAFDYIPKPVYQETLLRVTAAALKHKALIEEKEKYRSNLEAVFRSVKDAIITVDEELTVVELNEAAQELCGFSRSAIGKPLASFPQACDGCLEALRETIEERKSVEVQNLECRLEARPAPEGSSRGARRVVSLTTSPLIDAKGGFSGAVMVVRDVTRLTELERDLRERLQFHNIVGKSDAMQRIYSLIEDLADIQSTVLVTGESGTGKELVAEALHYSGERKNRPLVKVNCSALTESLLESELFGHVRGAFTGAVHDKIGRFEKADGGTIFLDEIGDVSQGIQQKLLRVLQEMEFERVGSSTSVKVDVRVVAATNKDLRERVRLGHFREDLYYRLKVVEISLPPLRDRREDIPLLIDHFLTRFAKKFNKEITAVSANVQKVFLDYSWPGNVRELEHVLEHAFILCNQNTIVLDHLPLELKNFAGTRVVPPQAGAASERREIIEALEKTNWNKAKAAQLLGMSRRTIYRKIEEYGITRWGDGVME